MNGTRCLLQFLISFRRLMWWRGQNWIVWKLTRPRLGLAMRTWMADSESENEAGLHCNLYLFSLTGMTITMTTVICAVNNSWINLSSTLPKHPPKVSTDCHFTKSFITILLTFNLNRMLLGRLGDWIRIKDDDWGYVV